MKETIFLILCLLCSIGAIAQTKSITGVVTDGTGESVIGASVVEVGTTNGTITNLDGKFSLTIATGAKFTVSYIGYKPQTITVSAANTYNVVLKEDTEVLDEVVITGYGGSQKRATLTTAISKLDNSVLKMRLSVMQDSLYKALLQVFVLLTKRGNLVVNRILHCVEVLLLQATTAKLLL